MGLLVQVFECQRAWIPSR